MLLTQLALKAKTYVGHLKITDMFNNELYAFNVLAQANLSDNVELVELSQKISYEFEIGFNLVKAMKSYIHNIEEFNGDDKFLQQSKHLLIKFANHLYGLKINETSYHQAVEKFLLDVDASDRTFSINLARKFYRYWRAANRQHTEGSQRNNYKLIDQKKAFSKFWKNIDKEFFSHLEMCVLTHYAETMLDKGLADRDILESVRIAKVITLELRKDQTSSDETYRDAIHRSHLLFEKEELNKLFLIVSREFYQIWLGNIPKIINEM